MTEISEETRELIRAISMSRAEHLVAYLPGWVKLFNLTPRIAQCFENQFLVRLDLGLSDIHTYDDCVESLLRNPQILKEPEVAFLLQLLQLEDAVKNSGVETQEVISDATCSPNHN